MRLNVSILATEIPIVQFSPRRTHEIAPYAATWPVRAPQFDVAKNTNSDKARAACRLIDSLVWRNSLKRIKSFGHQDTKNFTMPVENSPRRPTYAYTFFGVQISPKAGYNSWAVTTGRPIEKASLRRTN